MRNYSTTTSGTHDWGLQPAYALASGRVRATHGASVVP
jgi:hypothetical protein